MSSNECQCKKVFESKNEGVKCKDCLKCQSKATKNISKVSKQSQQHHIVEETSETGEVHFHCTACRRRFRSRTQKYYHFQCCNQNETYKCDICEKSFVRLSQLKYHRESHVSPINECPKCQKTFSNPLALKKHESLHKVEPKPCPHCDKTFLKKNSLEQHIAAQHLHQLEYGCAFCNKKYASKSTLQQHLQSHEEKRFECTFCGKHFQRKSILKLHLKRHYQTSTYTCQVCYKIFTESGALARHRKIHEENTRQYHCILCDKNILRKDNMNRHMTTIHPDEKYEDVVQVIKPSTQNVNTEQISQKCEENQVENEVCGSKEQQVVFYESIKTTKEIEQNIAESPNNFVIIENKLLQSPLLDTNKLHEYERTQSHDNTYNGIESSKCYADDLSIHLLQPSPLQNKIQVIMAPPIKDTIFNEFAAPYDNALGEVLKNNLQFQNDLPQKNCPENQISNSHSLLLDQQHVVCNNNHSSNSLKTLDIQQENRISTFFQESRNLVQNSLSNACKNNVNPLNDFENMNHQIRNKPSVIRSIGNVTKKLTPNIINESIAMDYEYKHKKYNRHYNVDLYRKILGCDDNDDDYDNDEGQQKHDVLTSYNLQQDNSTDAANTTTVHWRKSFKNIYETSTS